jgi:hypothetical protein
MLPPWILRRYAEFLHWRHPGAKPRHRILGDPGDVPASIASILHRIRFFSTFSIDPPNPLFRHWVDIDHALSLT